jgi:hypothetical protein
MSKSSMTPGLSYLCVYELFPGTVIDPISAMRCVGNAAASLRKSPTKPQSIVEWRPSPGAPDSCRA